MEGVIVMGGRKVIVSLLWMAICSPWFAFGQALSSSRADDHSVPANVRKLMRVYPDFIEGFSDNRLLFTDGSSLRYDDGAEKDFLTKLDRADVEDMFSVPYDTSSWTPSYLHDPGRIRCDSLFRKMYGNTQEKVRSHLVKVDWFGQKIPFTSLNGAADSLRAVAADLMRLPAEYRKFLQKSSSFYWRKVRGADRLSAHSYGMTIDICVQYSDFWLWANPGKSEIDHINYKNRIPKEIVRAFERHGFISGVRWYHFDTMHFEFRPELLP